MKTRVLSGMVYMAILIAAYVLKVLVHDLCFDLLIYAFALIGTHEIVNAVGDKLTKSQKVLVFAFAIVGIPLIAIAEVYGRGVYASAVCFLVFTVLNLCLFVVKHEESTPENVGMSFFCAVYPTLMLVPLVLVNHIVDTATMEKYAFNSNLAILLIWVISPISDTFAYLFGKFLRGKFQIGIFIAGQGDSQVSFTVIFDGAENFQLKFGTIFINDGNKIRTVFVLHHGAPPNLRIFHPYYTRLTL